MRGKPPGGLPAHEVPAWRRAYGLARKEGATETEARAHASGVLVRARKAHPDARGRELLDAADAIHGATCRILRIKASPPSYDLTASSIRDLLLRAWSSKAIPPIGQAVDDLAEITSSADPAVTKWTKGKKRVQELGAELQAIGDFGPLDDTDRAELGRLLAVAYRLGKKEIAEPLGFSVDFSTADRDALHGLHGSGIYWIGKRYGETLDQAKLLEIVKDTTLTQGLGRVEAGRRLALAFGNEIQKGEAYWTGLAATVATWARSFGAVEALRSNGGKRYEFVNPDDEVTSDVCRCLNGTVWTVSGAVALRDKLLTLQDPESWKEASPWPRPHELLTPEGAALWKGGGLRDADGALDPGQVGPYRKKPGELQAAGIAWPPLHFHCRSSIAVRVWHPLDSDGVDPLGDVEPEAYKPPKPGPKPGGKAKPAPAQVVDHVPAPLAPPPWSPKLPASIAPLPGEHASTMEARRAWRALLRAQGYTNEELTAIEALPKATIKKITGYTDPALDELYELYAAADREALTKIAAAYPPAVPVELPDLAWLPPAEALGDKGATAWFAWKEEAPSSLAAWYRSAFYGQKGEWAETAAVSLAEDVGGNALGGLLGTAKNRQEKIEILLYLEGVAKKGDDQAMIDAIADLLAEDRVPWPWVLKAPKVPPLPPPPTVAPVVTTPIPVPVVAAPELAPTVAEVPIGVLEAHPGYDWHPGTLIVADPDPKAWASALEANGYGPGEIAALWGTGKKPGPLQLVADDLEELRQAAGWAKGSEAFGKATRERFAGTLKGYPPAKVVGMDPRPAPFLSPAELGARLSKSSAGLPAEVSSELGAAYRDAVDGSIWIVAEGLAEDQARAGVVASSLLRRLGVEVPDVRLVQVDGKITSAIRHRQAWKKVTDVADLASAHGDELARAMPADAWIGSWNTFGTGDVHVAQRADAIPGQGGGVLRLGFRSVFDFRFQGAKKPPGAWAAGKVSELEAFLNPTTAQRAATAYAKASGDRSLLIPMMERIAGLDVAEIDAAISLGGLQGQAAAELRGVLQARAAWLGEEAKRVRVQLVQEAKERAAEAIRQAEAAAKRAKLAAELQARIARGEIPPPGWVAPGLDLERLAPGLELGPIPVAGDHRIVRDQAIRVTRYQLKKAGKVAEDGFELGAVLDSTSFPEVSARLEALAARPGATSGQEFRSWRRLGKGRGAVATFDGSKVDPFLGSGRWVDTPRFSVDFNGTIGRKHTSAYLSTEGRIRIRIKATDPKEAQAELLALLRDLGIQDLAAAPTAEAQALMTHNRAAWNVLGSGYRAHKRGSVLKLKDADAVLRASGINPEALQVEAVGVSGYSTVTIPGRGDSYRKRFGARFLYHELGSDFSDGAGVSGTLGRVAAGEAEAEAGGLFATTERYADGVFVSGMSSGSDLSRGPGATHVFTRLVGEQSAKGSHSSWYSSSRPRVLISPEALDRVDWYHNGSDEFGELFQDRLGADAAIESYAKHGSTGHEIMIRHTIPKRDLLVWGASSADQAAQIVARAKAQGITTWHGYPIEKMVIVMRNPSDVSGFDRTNPIHAYLMGIRDNLEGVYRDP